MNKLLLGLLFCIAGNSVSYANCNKSILKENQRYEARSLKLDFWTEGFGEFIGFFTFGTVNAAASFRQERLHKLHARLTMIESIMTKNNEKETFHYKEMKDLTDEMLLSGDMSVERQEDILKNILKLLKGASYSLTKIINKETKQNLSESDIVNFIVAQKDTDYFCPKSKVPKFNRRYLKKMVADIKNHRL